MKILEQPLYDYVLFDLETTGLDTVNDQIVEISALKVAGGKIVDEYSTLVNPGIHIPYQASCINGITDDMVKDSPTVEEAIRGFKLFAGDEVLIGHNIIRFDMAFITRDVRTYLGKNMDNELVDTVILSRRLLPELDRHSLEALAAHYNVSYEGAHRALADCYINMKVYEHLCEELSIGDKILVNNGLVICEVKEINGPNAVCTVLSGGVLSDRKSMNFPKETFR